MGEKSPTRYQQSGPDGGWCNRKPAALALHRPLSDLAQSVSDLVMAGGPPTAGKSVCAEARVPSLEANRASS